MKNAVPLTLSGLAPRIRFKNILFATDLGSASEHAQACAVLLARMFGANLFVLHVETGPGIAQRGHKKAARQESTAPIDATAFNELEQFFKVSGVPYTMLVEHGEVQQALARVADDRGIDLIVLGSHGRHGISYLFLGSMAEEVTRTSTCPVITVGPCAHAGFDNSLKTIVYATDFSPESNAALPYAASLAQEFHANLTVVHVAPKREEKHVQPYLMAQLKSVAPPALYPWCTVNHTVAFGETVEEILEKARETRADLIVVGLHSSVRFTSHLPERLSYRILCEAPCPVMSVFPGAAELKLAELSGPLLAAARYSA